MIEETWCRPTNWIEMEHHIHIPENLATARAALEQAALSVRLRRQRSGAPGGARARPRPRPRGGVEGGGSGLPAQKDAGTGPVQSQPGR